MADYLFELGCEEIPARFLDLCITHLRACIEKQLKADQIGFKSIESMATPRRLAIQIIQCDAVKKGQEKIVTGPPLTLAKNEAGQWQPAAIGFAKKCQVAVTDLIVHTDQKGREVVAIKEQIPDQPIQSIIPTIITESVLTLPCPIAMRWGDGEETFIRPIHWILSLLDVQPLPIKLFGVISENKSKGHRFLKGNKELTIVKIKDYATQLKKEGGVIASQEKRKKTIVDQLEKEGVKDPDQQLVLENANLSENPSVLKGKIDQQCLTLPFEVIEEVLKKHQKCFVQISSGKMTPYFYMVADGVTDKNRENIIKGNEKVVQARLNDALFFYNEDVSKPLKSYQDYLKRMTFQEKAGTIDDKIERIKKIGDVVLNQLNEQSEIQKLNEAAALSKCDLATKMVYEFTDLQGVIGSKYAALQNEDPLIVQAIEQHYWPLPGSERCPENPIATSLAVADRMDNLVYAFYSNQIPTGSKDPLALRRAVYAIIKIAMAHPLQLNAMIDQAYQQWGNEQKNKTELVIFIKQRIKTEWIEQGIRYDIADAVLDKEWHHIQSAFKKAQSLNELLNQNETQFKLLQETGVRIARLSKPQTEKNINEQYYENEWEKKQVKAILPKTTTNALSDLIDISEKMTLYFEKCLINHKDEKIKKNRLVFISVVKDCFDQVANFEKISG